MSKLAEAAIFENTADIWKNFCQHVDNVHACLRETDKAIDRMADRFVIEVCDE